MAMDAEDIHEIRQLVQEESNKIVEAIKGGWCKRGFLAGWGFILITILIIVLINIFLFAVAAPTIGFGAK